MPSRTMLIDASHPEETRVVVVDGNRVEDYDVEVASRRQLKGNIYLAKVTRVEPSLQAAFVDYGGNRHGFLAFNEIHPDYYQIPVADRERLLAEQAAASVERDDGDDGDAEAVGEDEDESERRRSRPPSRFYKIQEVIKRRQIMLVQVTKEERGNKGAALTTYLSLAGRYCVLMPNTARGGGISRKIASVTDRKRLKKMLTELEAPDGMAVIVRTAGAGRGKAEIKRDYEYLIRLWSSIRETTLQSTAPTLVYEEASLIKRSIRDLYDRDIEEIIVQGDEEYRISKEFMKLFISSHAKRVKSYENHEAPLFQKFGVEDQLASMHQPTVQLRSGGYIVINPTEALVAIDVNSGRSTRERNIEETALRTNLEAADEIAWQLWLRDLAGLIVIDFIDMENARNQGQVERRMKEAMKTDRARVQLGRISSFGLLELSRQRLRPSLIETSFEVCPACGGNGLRRTTESTALAILRKLEEEGLRRRSSEIAITVSPLVASYLLNQKRRSLQMIEDRYGVAVCVLEDADLVPPDHRLERLKPYDARVVEEAAEVEETPAEAETSAGEEPAAMEREEAGAGRGRRRRPRRRRRDDDVSLPPEEQVEMRQPEEADEEAEADAAIDADDAAADQAIEVTAEEGGDQPNRRRRRRGKRGGRRRARPGIALEVAAGDLDADEALEPIYADEVSQEEGYDGNSLDAAAASAVMDDDGGPIWSARTINDAEPSSPTAEVAFIDEAEAVPDVSDEELNEGVDNAEPGEAAPRTRRRSPRRSRSKRVLEAETADAAEPSASTDVAEPEDALIVAPIPMAIAEDVKEEALAAAAEQSSAEDEVRAPSPWSVSGDIATASAPHQAESSPAEVSVARGEFSRDEPGESLADAERNRAHREEEERRAEEARRTEVIQVGEGSNERDDNPRRGWWQRLLT
ncbi:MAG: ribonuclease E/G [Rhodospirillales bacterium]|nr:ribonuclease E/G [Rhodospirillales bacterium]